MNDSDPRIVNIKISGRDYNLKARDAENEEFIRKAAALIDKKVGELRAANPGKNEVDLLTFVSINICVNYFASRRKLSSLEEELKVLDSELDSYLSKY